MRIIALALWLATAGLGLYLLALRLSRGGICERRTKITSFPAALMVSHPVLAAAGLSIWTAFVLTRQVRLAWIAFAILCGSALLGFVLLTRWLTARGGRHARQPRQLPGYGIALHGLMAIGTFVFVLISATVATHA